MLQFAENVLFGHDIFLLVLFDDVLLLEHLHRVHLLVQLVPHQQHLRVRTLTDHRDRSVVVHCMAFHNEIFIHYNHIMHYKTKQSL